MKTSGIVLLLFAAILLLVATEASYKDAQGADQRISDGTAAIQRGDEAAFNEQMATEARKRQMIDDEWIAGAVLAIFGIVLFASGKSQTAASLRAEDRTNARLLRSAPEVHLDA